MSKFDYMNFEDDGIVIEFVVNAKLFTKEKALELCVSENDWKFDKERNSNVLREPKIDDIAERFVKYFVKIPEYCGCDGEGGCYTYCNKELRGCFPVWVISFEDLKV